VGSPAQRVLRRFRYEDVENSVGARCPGVIYCGHDCGIYGSHGHTYDETDGDENGHADDEDDCGYADQDGCGYAERHNKGANHGESHDDADYTVGSKDADKDTWQDD
jgi:hypothetical protein